MPTESAALVPPEEQFVDTEQRRYSAILGMWIFLATEVLFFGGPLLAYTAYRIWFPQEFATASRHLDFTLGTINTAVLLTSSFLMAGAITAARLRDRRSAIILLFLTIGCGILFLCIKGYEWYTAIKDGFWPGTVATAEHSGGVHLFYTLYFILTGLHGLHLLIGIALIGATAIRISASRGLPINENRLTLLGLYWHFIDIVWIFLYPLLYFIGRSS